MPEPLILFAFRSLKRKAVIALTSSILLALALGGGIAHYLISAAIYTEAEQRMEQVSRGARMSIQLAIHQGIENYLRGISDTHLAHIQLLDEKEGLAGKKWARELMIRQKVGESGYLVAIDCKDAEAPWVAAHPNRSLEGKGRELFPFILDECKTKRGLFEFNLNVPDVNNRAKSIWLNSYEPWNWVFGPAPFVGNYSELIPFEDLKPLLQEVNDSLNINVYVIKPDGTVLFHPAFEGMNVNELVDAKTGEFFARNILKEIQQKIRTQPASAPIKGKLRFHLQQAESDAPHEFISLYRYMPEVGWIIGVELDTNKIQFPTMALASALALSFIISAVIMIWLLNQFSLPFFQDIRALNRAVKRVGKGEFELDILSVRDDELGRLSQAFIDMTQRLAEADREQEEKNHKLEQLAITDSLTRVGNRRHFDQVIRSEIMRSHRTHTNLSLLLLDVDFFKSYNDHYGHIAGDECLRRIADVMRQSAKRSIDLVARYGGEEFALVAVDTDLMGSELLAQRILDLLVEQNIEHKESPYGIVTASIGLCVMGPNAGFSAESLVEQADAALYKAKASGRNRIESVRI